MPLVVAIDEAVVPFHRDGVRKVLLDWTGYPRWWRRYRFEVVGPIPVAVGSRLAVTRWPVLRAVATVSRLDEDLVSLELVDGSWRGSVRWTLYDALEGTRVVLRLDADPRPRWLRAVARCTSLGRRHSKEMRAVFEALVRHLDDVGEKRVPPPEAPGRGVGIPR